MGSEVLCHRFYDPRVAAHRARTPRGCFIHLGHERPPHPQREAHERIAVRLRSRPGLHLRPGDILELLRCHHLPEHLLLRHHITSRVRASTSRASWAISVNSTLSRSRTAGPPATTRCVHQIQTELARCPAGRQVHLAVTEQPVRHTDRCDHDVTDTPGANPQPSSPRFGSCCGTIGAGQSGRLRLQHWEAEAPNAIMGWMVFQSRREQWTRQLYESLRSRPQLESGTHVP
jgi:hypothetical protein